MNDVEQLDAISQPPGVRTQLDTHLARLARAEDLHTLALARERAEGFVEGIEAARALTPAIIEALFMAVDVAAYERRQGLTP